ncbi:MAG: hypothetical protein LBV54_06085 [Puniceicoccales bacterium]|nr:hypothetical protein [Puniceicoccales bacterium]
MARAINHVRHEKGSQLSFVGRLGDALQRRGTTKRGTLSAPGISYSTTKKTLRELRKNQADKFADTYRSTYDSKGRYRSSQYGLTPEKAEIGPNALSGVIIPRHEKTGMFDDAGAKELKKGNPIAKAMHERGHAADPVFAGILKSRHKKEKTTSTPRQRRA